MRVLLVDDDVFVRRLLCTMVPWEELGFTEVLQADNGKSGMEAVQIHHPNLIITDIKMPLVSGLELAKATQASMVETYVIVISAYNDFDYVRTSIQCGVSDYIVKPLSKERIRELIQKIRQISDDYRQKSYFRELLLDRRALERQLAEVLSGERDIHTLFDQRGRKESLTDYKSYCALVQDGLLAHMHEKGFPELRLTEMRREAASFIQQCNQIDVIINYTCDMAQRCTQELNVKAYSAQPYVDMMKEYIQNNFQNPDLGVSQIAQVVNLSVVYTGMLFKQQQDTTITAYINMIRINKAMSYLGDPTKTIADVSAQVGYTNADYFSRLFHRRVGMRPSEYRNMLWATKQCEWKENE